MIPALATDAGPVTKACSRRAKWHTTMSSAKRSYPPNFTAEQIRSTVALGLAVERPYVGLTTARRGKWRSLELQQSSDASANFVDPRGRIRKSHRDTGCPSAPSSWRTRARTCRSCTARRRAWAGTLRSTKFALCLRCSSGGTIFDSRPGTIQRGGSRTCRIASSSRVERCPPSCPDVNSLGLFLALCQAL